MRQGARGRPPAVHVDDAFVDPELVGRGEPDHANASLISKRSTSPTPARSSTAPAGWPGGLVEERGLGAGHLAVADQLAERVTPSSSALARDITTTAAPPSEICDALPAVMVPALSKAGRSEPRDSAVVPGRTPSSVSTTIGSPLRWGTSTATISSARRPSLMAAAAFSWWRREGVLALARDADLLVVALGGEPHGAVVEGAREAVEHHRVDEHAVAQAVAGPGTGQQVGAWSSTPCRRRPRSRRRQR